MGLFELLFGSNENTRKTPAQIAKEESELERKLWELAEEYEEEE